ncbi:dipeptidyl carboxypeptidase II, partial [Stenotrophomonas maltophilia]
QLSDADKASLRKLNVAETTLSTQFHTRLGAATAAAAVVGDDKAKLAGQDEDAINNAAHAAKERTLDGKFQMPLTN